MSVIITGMTMPNNCNDCGFVAEKAKTTCKSNGYPLKSIDGLLNQIKAEIQSLRNCSCSCSDGIIDDVEDILDKYKAETEDT